MKIAYIVRHFELDKLSMIPKICYNIAKTLSKNYKIGIITENKNEREVFINKNLKIIYTKNIFLFLKDKNYTIIHYWGRLIGLLECKLFISNNKKLIANIYADIIQLKFFKDLKMKDFFDSRILSFTKTGIIELLLVKLFKKRFRNTLIIVNSKKQKDNLSKVLKNLSIKYITHGLFGNEYNKISHRDKKKYVLYFGHPYNARGIDLLIKIAPHIIKIYPNLKFIFIFSTIDDGKPNRFINLIKKNISSKNYKITNKFVKDVKLQYKNIDVLVLPYKTEIEIPPLPLVLLEGLSQGIPVLTTNINSITELLPNKNIIICKKNSETDLLVKLKGVLNKKKNISHKKNVVKKFSETNLINFLSKTYKDNWRAFNEQNKS